MFKTKLTCCCLKTRVKSFQGTTVKISTMIGSAIFLKDRRIKEKKSKWKKWWPFSYNPWREKSDIYCGLSRMWRHQSSSVYILEDIWAAGMPRPLAKACWLPWHPLIGQVRASSMVALAATERRRALRFPFVCPSHSCAPWGKRETGKFIAGISGPMAIYKKETEWDIWSY